MPGRKRSTFISNFSAGWNSNYDSVTVPDNFVTDIANGDFEQPGKVVTRPGTEKVADQVSPLPGTGLFPFIASNGTEYLVSKFGGTLYWVQNPTDTNQTPISGSVGSGIVEMTQMNGLLFIADGANPLKQWTGTGALVTSTGIPTGTPLHIRAYENRLYIVMVQEPNKIYYSNINDPTNFGTAPGNNMILPSDGYTINALSISEASLIASRGKAGVWIILFNVSGLPIAQRTAAWRGAVNNQAIAQYENAAMFLSKDAVRLLGQLPYFPTGLRGESVSEPIQRTINALQTQFISTASSVYFNRKLYLSVPVNNAVNNDSIITLYSGNNAWSFYSNIYAAQMVEFKDYLYFTDSRRGQLWRFNPILNSDNNTEAIPFRMVTKNYDLGTSDRKFLERVVFRFRADQITNLQISVSFDFGPYQNLSIFGTGATLDGGAPMPEVGDMELYPASPSAVPAGTALAADNLLFYQRVFSTPRQFYYISFKFEHNTPGKRVQIVNMTIDWKECTQNDYTDIN